MKLNFHFEVVLKRKYTRKSESCCLDFVRILSCFSISSVSGAAVEVEDREQMGTLTWKRIQKDPGNFTKELVFEAESSEAKSALNASEQQQQQQRCCECKGSQPRYKMSPLIALKRRRSGLIFSVAATR